jgi:hypothetical protein
MTTFVSRSKFLLKTKDPKGKIQFKGVTEPEMIQEKPNPFYPTIHENPKRSPREKTLDNPIR